MSLSQSLLRCPSCKQAISATVKVCPHCHCKMSLWREVKFSIEQSPVRLAITITLLVLLVGCAWYVRMNSGYKWPLYVVLVGVAPLVPWLLKSAYLFAGAHEETASQNPHTDDTLNKDT